MKTTDLSECERDLLVQVLKLGSTALFHSERIPPSIELSDTPEHRQMVDSISSWGQPGVESPLAAYRNGSIFVSNWLVADYFAHRVIAAAMASADYAEGYVKGTP